MFWMIILVTIYPTMAAISITILQEAKKLIKRAYDRTQKLLEDNKQLLEKLYTELLKQETLSYDDVVSLIGLPPFEGKHQVLQDA